MKIRRLILSVLASLPLGTISFAARSASQDAMDKNQGHAFQKTLQTKRAKAGQPDTFWQAADKMEQKGLINHPDAIAVPRTPSIY